jgi:hypothetical protein
MSESTFEGKTSRQVPFTNATTALQKFAEALGTNFGLFVEKVNRERGYAETLVSSAVSPLTGFYEMALPLFGYPVHLDEVKRVWELMDKKEHRQGTMVRAASLVGLSDAFEFEDPCGLTVTLEQMAKHHLPTALRFWEHIVLLILAYHEAADLLKIVDEENDVIKQALTTSPVFWSLVRLTTGRRGLGNTAHCHDACSAILPNDFERGAKAIMEQMLIIRS